jgi:two-component system, OmpR family, sensor histidine kinase ChvG
MHEHPSFFQSLRFKLLLASLTLLLIPWAGYHYLQEMESTLREAQERQLLSRAEIVANMLASEAGDWLQRGPSDRQGQPESLYVHPLNSTPDIDGYADEWQKLHAQSKRFNARNSSSKAISFDWLAGFYGENLYLMIEVYDDRLVYPRSDHQLTEGDHLLLALPGPNGKARQFYLGTPAPGWINVIEAKSGREQPQVRGEWQETASGYRIELRLPRSLTDGRLSLAAIDIDQKGKQTVGIASTSGWQYNQSLAYLTLPTGQANGMLQGLESPTHRYSIVNIQHQVIGRLGSISVSTDNQNNPIRRLISSLLSGSTPAIFEKRERLSRLDGPEIRQALSGHGAVYRYQTQNSNLMMLSSAFPIRIQGEIQGAVVVEQSTQEILLLQQSALENLLLISIGLFLITGGSLLLLASSITHRITQLNQKYQQAVSQDGRIIQEVTANKKNDELGRLDSSLNSVLKRTKAYGNYLESMASRLAHEFRTPLAIIQSSLENLQADLQMLPPKENSQTEPAIYAERALEGTRRLNLILTRLREATRLEQALQDTKLMEIDITALIKALSQGYADTYRPIEIEFNLPNQPIFCLISPDLISLAMDKLLSNAVDFHLPQTPIQIDLINNLKNKITIKVINQGPQLEESVSQNLFHSMASHRPHSQKKEPHLGLGLYLVRLIAEFHQGKAWAENQTNGVCFTVELPIQHKSPQISHQKNTQTG